MTRNFKVNTIIKEPGRLLWRLGIALGSAAGSTFQDIYKRPH